MRSPRSFAFLSSAGIFVAPAAFVAVGACASFRADDSGSDPAADAAIAADVPSVRDAGDAADGGGSTNAFCAQHVNDPGLFFCNDLEPPNEHMPHFGFTDSTVTPSTTDLQVIGDGQRTAVLRASVDSANVASHEVDVSETLPAGAGGPPTFQIDVDIKIVGNDASYVTLAALHLAGNNCEASYGLGAFDGQTLGGTRNRDVTLRPYTQGEWKHLTISLSKSGSSATGYRELTTYDGTVLVDRDAHASNGAMPTDCVNGDVVLGATETGATKANVIVLFDNLLVRKL